MKQSKLRKRRVWRYAVLYFVMLVVFVGLIVGPIVAGTQITNGTSSIFKNPSSTMYLLQPVGLNNNDTRGTNETGTGAPGRAGATGASTSSGSAATGKVRLF
jgi:1,3-beta-glucan synthase